MTALRQDAWTTDEDLILAEVVLRHIREGSTQLAAFEEVGKRLSRTGAACGFRWNSTIRKKYESAILLAKKQRSKGKRLVSSNHEVETANELQPKENERQPQMNTDVFQEEKTLEPTITLEKAVSFLNDYVKYNQERVSSSEYEALQEENNRLKQKLEKIEREKRVMEEDYRTLLAIMERARKLRIHETVSEA